MSSVQGRSTPCGIPVDVVGHAVVANGPLGVLPSRSQLVSPKGLERSHEGRRSADGAARPASSARRGRLHSVADSHPTIATVRRDRRRASAIPSVRIRAVWCHHTMSGGTPQIEREGKVGVSLFGWNSRHRGRVPAARKPREAPALGFVRVDGKLLETPPSRMRYMIDAAADRALVPPVHEIEHQRGVNAESSDGAHWAAATRDSARRPRTRLAFPWAAAAPAGHCTPPHDASR